MGPATVNAYYSPPQNRIGKSNKIYGHIILNAESEVKPTVTRIKTRQSYTVSLSP